MLVQILMNQIIESNMNLNTRHFNHWNKNQGELGWSSNIDVENADKISFNNHL